jgi:hypothetical protein
MAIIETIDLLIGRKSKPPSILSSENGLVLLKLDVAINEEHIYENRIPQFPIDTANTISDHIWKLPDQLKIQGQVSNAPIQSIITTLKDTTAIGGTEANKVLTAYEVLLALTGRKLVRNYEDIAGKGIPSQPIIIDIITNLCVFNNMVVRSLRIPRNAGIKDELMFDVEFVQITKTTIQDTNIQYVNEKIYGAEGVENQKATQDVGKQPQVETKADNRTILKRLTDGGKKNLDKYGDTIKQIMFGE